MRDIRDTEHRRKESGCLPRIEQIEPQRGVSAWVRRAVRDVGLTILGNIVPPSGGHFLRPLMMHSVPETVAPRFRAVMQRLQGMGNFVDSDTCLAMLRGDQPIRGRNFHLSFDDGGRDFILHAAPVLDRLGIPATVFVITDLVGLTREQAGMDRMSWQDLRTIQSWGFEVGSHTRTHARLADFADPARLDYEIAGSKHAIEERLGTECRYIAWPYGRPGDVSAMALRAVAAAGYQGCFGGFRGSIASGTTSRWRIPRHHLDASWPWGHIRFFIHGYGERNQVFPD